MPRKNLSGGPTDDQISRQQWAPKISSARERRVVAVMICLGAIVSADAILHHGVMGQDFSGNYSVAKAVSEDFRNALAFTYTNPPAFYFLGALIIRLTGGVHDIVMIGIVNLLINSGALWIFYRLSLYLIDSAALRVTAVLLLTFLPVRMIHSVVFAGDALTMLPICGVMLALLKMQDEPSARRRIWLAAGLGILLCVSVCIKYTFMSTIVGCALILVQMVRRRTIEPKEFMIMFMIVVLPASLIALVQIKTHKSFTNTLNLKGTMPNQMSYRTLFSIKGADKYILTAPPYNEPIPNVPRIGTGEKGDLGPPYELLTENRHGYLALLHLAAFTDSINIFQYDPTDDYFGRRNARNQRLMALAVKTALPITLGCVASIAYLIIFNLPALIFAPTRVRPNLEIALVLSLAWFLNIFLFLPFVDGACIGGYWTPRLILPALLLFVLLMFHVLDRLLPGPWRTFAIRLILGYVTLQSALHVSFLWPWGVF